MKKVLVDSGFWIALFDERDKHHDNAVEFWECFSKELKFIIPHPTLYEFLNTRMRRKKYAYERIKNLYSGAYAMEFVSDEKYKMDALELTLDERRDISLVDMTIRLMLGDEHIYVDTLLTTNKKDFYDVCAPRLIDVFEIEERK